MARMQWDLMGSREFSSGLDQGVLYLEDGSGVPWNGLIEVSENQGNSLETINFDGRVINQIVRIASYTGTIRAYTYPEEFSRYIGHVEDSTGMLLAEQSPRRFSFSWRTKVADDVDPDGSHYRIHIVYDAVAIPETRAYRTLGLDASAEELSWRIEAVPSSVSGYRPTSHVILDTRRISPWVVADIEEILYGSDESDPYLPSIESFSGFLKGYDRIIITDNGDGTWTASTDREDAILVDSNGLFTIVDANATFIDPETYEISSTDKEELWRQ